MRVPFTDLGSVGLIKDEGGHKVPFTAWTDARNVRFVGPYVEKAPGYSAQRATSVAPYFVTTFPSPTQTYHVYAGLEKVYAWIGSTQAEITRTSGPYTGGSQDPWQAAVFNGLLILNNGVDVPQVWNPPALSTRLVDLPNWPANTTARIIRPFKSYLVALDVTKTAGRDPRLIKWSHSAGTGVPTSWDETDATKEAGEQVLPEGQDQLIDCLPLRDVNIVYGESSTWAMSLTSLPFVFRFDRLFATSGLLAPGCAVHLGAPLNMHLALTLDDCIVHNGQSYESIFERRLREWFFNNLNQDGRMNTRVVANRKQNEVWIFFPYGPDTTLLNLAMVWNWVHNTWSVRDVPECLSVVEVPLEVAARDSWAETSGTTWSTMTETWGAGISSRAALNSLLIAALNDNEIVLVDTTYQADGSNYSSYVERKGIDLSIGPSGPFHDPRRVRMGLALFPQFEGSSDIVFTVKLGHHDTPDGEVTWDSVGTWSPGDERVKPDLQATGRYLAVRFEESGSLPWRAYGFELEIVSLGER